MAEETTTPPAGGPAQPAAPGAAAPAAATGGEAFQAKDFGNATGGAAGRSIEFLLDVPLTLSVELGRTRMIVNDLLQLGQGSVVELSKLVGEPLEVLVNEKLIARGEVVVLNDKFAVRLTDIISPKDRLDKLS